MSNSLIVTEKIKLKNNMNFKIPFYMNAACCNFFYNPEDNFAKCKAFLFLFSFLLIAEMNVEIGSFMLKF